MLETRAKPCANFMCSEIEKSFTKIGKEMDMITKTTCLQYEEEFEPGLVKSPSEQGMWAAEPPGQYEEAVVRNVQNLDPSKMDGKKLEIGRF